MTSQTRRLSSRQGNSLPGIVGGEGRTHIGEGFLTRPNVTNVRFLARVSARVHGQSAALDETLVAIRHLAMVRPLVGVYAIMPTEI